MGWAPLTVLYVTGEVGRPARAPELAVCTREGRTGRLRKTMCLDIKGSLGKAATVLPSPGGPCGFVHCWSTSDAGRGGRWGTAPSSDPTFASAYAPGAETPPWAPGRDRGVWVMRVPTAGPGSGPGLFTRRRLLVALAERLHEDRVQGLARR